MNWIERTLKRLRGILEQEAERAIPMSRVQEQIWELLNGQDADPDVWSWPIDVFVDDDGSLFVIVAQGGKLYRVGLNIAGENVSLGNWIQVTQVFEPVRQTARFLVRRQADGSYRWLMVAATAVLNRVGEIDSTALFDSFIARAERSGKYPRLDFYHMGGADRELWEFGTADYLARDGVCYIASGTFDMEHPLAQATIRATEREPGKWGASIEFRAHGEPQLIAAEPEVRIPVYLDGENTRISVVLEKDAAGWFTRLGIQEVERMNKEIMEKLRELFGEDAAALEQFEGQVDGVNRTVTEEGLIHRSQAEAEAEGEGEETDDGDEAEEGETGDIVLDEDAVRAISQAVVRTDLFTTMHEAVNTLSEANTILTRAYEAQSEETAALREQIGALKTRLKALERDEADKQQAWLEDLPAKRTTKVSYRPRLRDAEFDEDEGDDEPDDLTDAAERTLEALPAW